MGLFVGWTIIVTSIFLIDTDSRRATFAEQAQREELRVQERLSELELLNDSRAAEVRRAQQRFAPRHGSGLGDARPDCSTAKNGGANSRRRWTSSS